MQTNQKTTHLLSLLPTHSVVFTLFFWGASHLRNNWTLICAYWTLPRTPKNQTVQQEFQISVLDKSVYNWLFVFFPAPKFETLARRPQLCNKKIRPQKKILLRDQKNKKKRAKVSSGFTKKQVQALRVFKKISTTHAFSKQLFYQATNSDFQRTN